MGARTRKGGRRIKRKTQKKTDTEDQAATPPPRAFVFTKGKVSGALKALVEDLKSVLSPNTARALRARKTNKLRDFVDVAGELNVSFFLIVSATDKHSYLRVVRTPQGPTLTFRINSFSLAADLAATLRRPYSVTQGVWQSSPLLVLSDFDKTVQHELLTSTVLQNLFPEFNVADAKLAACRRVVLVHKTAEGETELRQYVIQAVPTGVR
jgi:ribosome biogenesis protein SSF1/2